MWLTRWGGTISDDPWTTHALVEVAHDYAIGNERDASLHSNKKLALFKSLGAGTIRPLTYLHYERDGSCMSDEGGINSVDDLLRCVGEEDNGRGFWTSPRRQPSDVHRDRGP